MLAASTGGHLAQLHRIAPKLDIDGDPLWVTFENEQSKSLLYREKNVFYLPYIASRDWRAASATFAPLRRIFQTGNYDMAFSTGAAIAVPVTLAAAMSGMRRYYLESVSRFDGPSLSGKLVAQIPGTRVYTQHERWANKRWQLGPSVLDNYALVPRVKCKSNKLKIFVTLGTIKPYRFDRAVDAICAAFGDHDITWQLGATQRNDLPGHSTSMMDSDQFDSQVELSDVVITHAGVGSAMRIMDLGKTPVVITRLKSFGEHVDNHQEQITRELTKRGLGYELNLDCPSLELLQASMSFSPASRPHEVFVE